MVLTQNEISKSGVQTPSSHFVMPLSGKEEPMAHFPSDVDGVVPKLSNPIAMFYILGRTRTSAVKLLLPVCTILVTFSAFGQTDCTPTSGGGYSCYDYETGSYSEATPRSDGGYSVYDYSSGGYKEVTPNSSGGYNIYDYDSGS